MRATMVLILLSGCASFAHAQKYESSFRPSALQDRPAGRPNEVLVLGSPHLSGLPETFRPEMVEPLVARLIGWGPTAVTSENLSGLQCDSLRRQPDRFASIVKSYCYDPSASAQATGLDVPAANSEAEKMLADWSTVPSPAQRRRLAVVFLAAGEPASATVQWLRLPETERRAEGSLTNDLTTYLNGRIARKNETYLVAAQVAARSGLERVWSVDDQSFAGDSGNREAYGAALTRAWDNPATKARAAIDDNLYARIGQPNALLELYRALNLPSFAAQKYQSDWGAALTETSDREYGRRYVGYWETRNLRMVANIREVLGRNPGTKLLAIVGASHKGYFEAYLSQMRDVTLVNVEPVLG